MRTSALRLPSFLVITGITAMLAACGGGSGGPPRATLVLSQSSINFAAAFGGLNPNAASVNVSSSGPGTLTFVASSDSPWLKVSPASGSVPQTLQVSAALGSLTTASYVGHITVTATGANGSPATITANFNVAGPAPSNTPFWAQWGANPQHTGMVGRPGQTLNTQLADIVYDKFASQEAAENISITGQVALTAHYQATLVDGNDVYMMTKAGTFTSCNPVGNWINGAACGPNTRNAMIWNESRFTWENGQLIHIWDFASDWKPVPISLVAIGTAWEPVFHAAEANGSLYVPGASGTVWKINKSDGTVAAHINPLTNAGNVPQNTYELGPLTADASGKIYYDVIELTDPSQGDPWQNDPIGSWLVQITPQDTAAIVSYAALTPNAPPANGLCPAPYFVSYDPAVSLPWPPAGFPPAPTVRCGPQRPGLNVAPAVAPNGTIYTVSRARRGVALASFIIAVNPNLTLKWATPMQNLLSDGCGVIVPINDISNSNVNYCRFGTPVGVDPNTGMMGSVGIPEAGSSSPTVLPDGSILFGGGTGYDAGRGHLLHFDAQGNFLNAFDFGWDSTPAVYQHTGTYSIVIKDNHYPVPFYCQGNPGCQNVPEVYYISQLDPNMNIEWSFQSTNTQSCQRNPNGTLTCVSDHPNGFEWCINMPAVDANGTVYANSEDGNVYAIPQGNIGVFTTPLQNIFLNLAIGAAYTPLSIGPDGKFYTQNDGHLFVVGN